MAYDEGLAQRLRDILFADATIVEKKMFGGVAFMRRGHMCVGVVRDNLLARVGPELHDEALSRPHARVMDFTGKPMNGFIYVAPDGLVDDDALTGWVALCRRFNDSMPAK